MTPQQEKELAAFQSAIAEARAEAKSLCYKYMKNSDVGHYQEYKRAYDRYIRITKEYFQWEIENGI